MGKKPGLNASEIARDLGLNRTIVTRLIASLLDCAWVVRNGDDYSPAPLTIALSDATDEILQQSAGRWIQQMANEIGCTIVVQGFDDKESTVLIECVPEVAIGLVVRHEVGSKTSLERSASSAALVAGLHNLDKARANRVLNELSDRGKARVIQCLSDGFAVSAETVQPGACGIAVPVVAAHHRTVYSLAALATSAEASTITRHLDALEHAAVRLVADLEGFPK